MNKSDFAYVLIVSFVAISVFGFFGFGIIDHDNVGGHTCTISALSGGDCSFVGGITAVALHHLAWLQNFTHFAMSTGATLIALYISILLAVVIPLVWRFLFQELNNFLNCVIIVPRKLLLRWLAIHNRRDPYAI